MNFCIDKVILKSLFNMHELTLERKVDSLNQIKELGLTLELNPLQPTIKEKPSKLYQVVTDMFNTKLIEHDVKEIVDGKTKYNSETKLLTQSKRFILNDNSVKVDIFNDNENITYQTYIRNGKEYDIVSYYFTNKSKAIKKLIDENYRLLIQEISYM